MKTVLSVFFILFAMGASAQSSLTVEQQLKIVEKAARLERRELWRNDHINVHSHVVSVKAEELDKILTYNDRQEEPLNQAQLAQIYECQSAAETCVLYLIRLYSNQYGGDGIYHVWVLLNPLTGKYKLERSIVYIE
jgi:hypothetical protein